jgi:Mn2+/Fe2+ NRAMP family transporter
MGKFLSRLGPGMMLAAVAVGVSHLVFSTQAGANYGFSLIGLIVVVVALKYPAFLFSVQYASATGKSLVTGYANIGKPALMWLVAGFFVDTFIATGAVALVTAGLFISVFNIPFTGPQVAVALMVVSGLILLNGQYARAERIIKVLVLSFSVLAFAATLLSLPLIGDGGRAVFAELTPSRSLAVFVIAVAGWMPMPTNGAILISKWVCEKRAVSGDSFDGKQAVADFRIGYGLAVVLALCFLIMGTAVLFDADYKPPANPGAFATELLSIFTTVIGSWSYPIIALASLAVMWSTQIALMDAMPRLTDRLLSTLTGRADDAPPRYTKFLVVQVVGVSIILLFLMKGFTTFLYFATSMGFIAAPAIAYYNYVAMMSDEVPAALKPGRAITAWNWVSVIVMGVFALAFLYTSIT